MDSSRRSVCDARLSNVQPKPIMPATLGRPAWHASIAPSSSRVASSGRWPAARTSNCGRTQSTKPSTVGDLQTQQVLDNLAMFVYNYNSMPYFAIRTRGPRSSPIRSMAAGTAALGPADHFRRLGPVLSPSTSPISC